MRNEVPFGLSTSPGFYVSDDDVISDSDDNADIENWTEVSRKNSNKRKISFSSMKDSSQNYSE